MTSFQTFETTGTIDENGVLQVAPFVGVPLGQVRVSVCVPLNFVGGIWRNAVAHKASPKERGEERPSA